jgi:outer membrane protein assembly factor BamB
LPVVIDSGAGASDSAADLGLEPDDAGVAPDLSFEDAALFDLSGGIDLAVTSDLAPPADLSPAIDLARPADLMPACTASMPTGTRAVTVALNGAHDGYQPGETLAPPLYRRWSVSFAGYPFAPVVAEGRVFVGLGGPSAEVFAFDRTNGAQLWGPVVFSSQLGDRADLAYDNGRLFVVDRDRYSNQLPLSALDPATGAIEWSNALLGQSFFTAPVAGGGLVYVVGAGGGNTIYAVDQITGMLRWSVHGSFSYEAPTLSGGKVFTALGCNEASAFAAATGVLAWHHVGFCSGGTSRVSAVSADRLYASTMDQFFMPALTVFDTGTGAVMDALPITEVPALHAGNGFVLSGSVLSDIELATKRTVWSVPNTVAAPVIANGNVYTLDNTGSILAVDESNGRVQWSSVEKLYPQAELSVADGMLFVTGGHTLTAYSGCP